MSDKSFLDPDAYTISQDTEIIKVLTWNLWWKFEDYKFREKLILSGPTHIHRMTYRPMKDLKHKNRILHLDR